MTVSHCCLVFRAGSSALAALAGFCVLAVTACREESNAAANWDGAVRDSAGIEIIENFGTPLWREGEGWKLTEVLRIGVAEGEPEYEFGRISGIAVLSDRRIVVADAMAHQLRFFSPEGVHERTVGRQGQGPGEFGGGGLAPRVGPGDTLLVFDRRNQQAHVIAPDGTWLESYSTLPRDGYRHGLSRDAPPSGRLMTYHMPLYQSDDALKDTMDILLERDLHGAVLDTLARIPTYLSPGGSSPYYVDMVDVSLCERGPVIGHNHQYRSVWYGAGGAVHRIVSLARERLPLTEEDQAVMLGRYDQLLRENRVPADQAAAIRSSVRFTEAYPQYSQFTCGPAGTFLVQRVRPLRQLNEQERRSIRTELGRPPGGLEWDVFGSDGRYMGVAELPGTEWAAFVPYPRFVQDRATGAWYMYSAWADEQDVQYVVGWRVEGPLLD